jgi:hypothetical protein
MYTFDLILCDSVPTKAQITKPSGWTETITCESLSCALYTLVWVLYHQHPKMLLNRFSLCLFLFLSLSRSLSLFLSLSLSLYLYLSEMCRRRHHHYSDFFFPLSFFLSFFPAFTTADHEIQSRRHRR